MFDAYARSLLVDIPELEGLTGDLVARSLSRAYLALLQMRTNGPQGGNESAEAQAFLRRLSNALMFQVVLMNDRPDEQRRAAAFVSAESIALLADFISASRSGDVLTSEVFLAERFARVESALLYLYSQYDACAAGVLTLPRPVVQLDGRIDEQAAVWCLIQIEDFCQLRMFNSENSGPGPFARADALDTRKLEQDTIGRLYRELGLTVVEFSKWLSGGTEGLETSITRLDRVIAALSPQSAVSRSGRVGHDYARIYHLATLLRFLFPELSRRALCHVVPAPPTSDTEAYNNYIKVRAIGTAQTSGRPLLWPSAFEYVRECILGDVRHAVVSMPTGSGKSFVGELAVSQAVHSGWVLYLAPTNALAEQIRGDLRVGLEALQTEVFAFIGDQEYSLFASDSVAQMQVNSVAVMTPEKCALALRLSPDAFHNCSLVVFDECHLIGDSGSSRGPTAELVIAQLMLKATQCRFLLMSAIIQNPEDLAGWLASAMGGVSRPISIRWRPTRTLRSVLGVENGSFQTNRAAARELLASLPERRKNVPFSAKCSLAACLQGAWQSISEIDYGIVSVECDAPLVMNRQKVLAEWKYKVEADSWVNSMASNLAKRLAEVGVQTLVFTPASRHYPFSNGAKTILSADTLAQLPTPPPLVSVLRALAIFELGIESEVFELLDRGIAVHTSLMLEVEKIGSELVFKTRSAPVMYATGTLAQGLNLPAIAVIIAGTKIGDTRGEDSDVVEQRKFSQLLNAAGRAGRAGFANQGVVITIPDDPVLLATFQHVLAVRESADFLQQADNAVPVLSGLDQFLDGVCREILHSDDATDLDRQVVALLAGGDAKQSDPESILRRTYASYLRRQEMLPEVSTANVAKMIEVRDAFIADSQAPPWLTIAAQRAGLDFFLTLAIYRAWGQIRQQWPSDVGTWGVMEWLAEFLSMAMRIPPGLLARQLPPGRLSRVSNELKKFVEENQLLFFNRSLDWQMTEEWQTAWTTIDSPLKAWMRGDSIRALASLLTGKPETDIPSDRTQGKPIPRTLSVVGESWSSLSLVAGGFLAVAEQLFDGTVPLSLACLPMCIKYGCDSPGTLSWFRFGVRLRRGSRLLATVFPPPADLPSDDALRSWVRMARKEWLKGEHDLSATCSPEQLQVLDALNQFITA